MIAVNLYLARLKIYLGAIGRGKGFLKGATTYLSDL
ncbi:hypothetical protein RPO_06880 [Rickettsia rickettsii str. Arizona]|uniref:Transposase n=3 Tax=spotted fever group TaxID=114277 RepID=A0A0H3AYU1_RICRS|nr:hypothetical protein A1G_06830 [Rickettsia rickettsii str. 'Sheila Smith']AFB24153.1 hypothetical protein RPL_06865 [Rickettsia rickettsii str. Colombia]AFB25497.1 hypothetical protein RPO_06880 [Rickettsia rickettsii str. Arizona]AFB26844.1 hypothetical protein RSA_06860 [Rickettsia philipii str. 364D]AFB28177.1 hypothetical protein RPJ_06825 [Rickettsia rickettsii str. Hino]AFB29504.1 hypothetical protein RPK_06800 [Rickettsia rickettsii str. Hlp\